MHIIFMDYYCYSCILVKVRFYCCQHSNILIKGYYIHTHTHTHTHSILRTVIGLHGSTVSNRFIKEQLLWSQSVASL